MYVLSDIDDLFAALDEFLANLNNILGSRYLKLLRPKAEKLHKDVLYFVFTNPAPIIIFYFILIKLLKYLHIKINI